jgi:hypothetical protein
MRRTGPLGHRKSEFNKGDSSFVRKLLSISRQVHIAFVFLWLQETAMVYNNLIREILWIGLDVKLEEAMAVVKKMEILRTLRYVKKNRLKIII